MISLRPMISLSYASRREVVERVAPEYREALCAQKTLLLDTVVTMSGYARKYAIRLLNQATEGKRIIERQRLPRYGSQVQHALVLAWEVTRYIMGDARIVEIDHHPFFIGTLFQPERSAFRKIVHPLVKAFLQAAKAHNMPT